MRLLTMPLTAQKGPISDHAREVGLSLDFGGLTRVHEWITRGRGGAKQRGLRSDLVTLCICPHLLPCKSPSASRCARQHGVSRQRALRQRMLAQGCLARFLPDRGIVLRLGITDAFIANATKSKTSPSALKSINAFPLAMKTRPHLPEFYPRSCRLRLA